MRTFLHMVFALAALAGGTWPARAAEEYPTCGDEKIVHAGNIAIRSNLWNRRADGEKCINDGGCRWKWPDAGHDVQAFPHVSIEHSPWTDASTDFRFPVQVASVSELTASFDLHTQASGQFNTAFDVWITDQAQVEPDSVRAEIVIWLRRRHLNPAGEYRGTRLIGSTETAVYSLQSSTFSYVAFVLDEAADLGSLDLAAVVDATVELGLMKADWFIADIQLGNEIIEGSGRGSVHLATK